jgi:aminocarboxymuconate-semialdehyde decarboxylase
MHVDVHAHLVPEEAARRAEVEGDRFGVRAVRSPQGTVALQFAGGRASRPLFPGITSLDARREAMRAQGLDLQVVSPWVDLFGYTLDPERGEAWCRVLNDAMAAATAGEASLRGTAAVPLQDGRRAARELERAVGVLGLVGVEIGTNAAGRELDDPDLEPFWRACAQAGVPVFIHPVHVVETERFRPFYGGNLVGNPLDTTLAVAHLIFGGVMDRHPELRVILSHGGGYFPYQFGRLDRGRRVRPEAAGSRALPRDYLRRFHYDTVLHAVEPLRYLLDLVGADRVVLGTDMPFDMGDDRPRLTLESLGLSADASERVAAGNARELFRLDR